MRHQAAQEVARLVRVLFLHARLLHGGEDRLVQTLFNGMDRSRFEPVICCLYSPGPVGEEILSAGGKVYHDLAAGKASFGMYRKLREIIVRERIDVLYTTGSPLPLFWAGVLRRRGAVKRLVVGFHSMGWDEKRFQQWLAKKMALPVADLYVALSETHKEYIIEADGVGPDRFAIIPPGIDIERFKPCGQKFEFGFAQGTPVVGIVGALRREKNHQFFIEMAKSLRTSHPAARFVIVGDGPTRGDLEAFAQQQGVADTVVFLGAIGDVAPVVRAMDVLTLTSHAVVETFPQVLLEGMGCGLPVCTTDVGSVRDIVTHETGFITPPEKPEEMGTKVAGLLDDSELRHRMGAAGRDRVERLFTREQMIERYEKAFEAV